jgi:hypothetical protein
MFTKALCCKILPTIASILLCASPLTRNAFAQEPTIGPKREATVTRTDGRIVIGNVVSQDASSIAIDSDGMTISIPTALVASITYDTTVGTASSRAGVSAAEEILRALRKLAVANDTGVSLLNFGPMLIQAKTDVVEPLRLIGEEKEFTRVIHQSLEAYQHAFEAWQLKTKSEFVFSSDDYGKWAISTYAVKKHGLLKTVFLEEVRQAALNRARDYFQKAEALGLEMRKSQSMLKSNTSTEAKSFSRLGQAELTGRWIVEVVTPDGSKRQTFTLEVEAGATHGRVAAFAGASLIENITTAVTEPNLFIITTVPEKINKKPSQVVFRLHFASENHLTGTLQLRRLSDGDLSQEVQLSAIRARD